MMAQSRAFVDASHALNGLSHAIALLESENAKLSEQGARLFDKTLELGTENERLRELVRDMMEFFEDGDWCVKCERARDCQEQEQYEDECLMRFVFRDRMRELGIEVTGK